MKKIQISLILVMITAMSFGQNLFTDFENMDGVTSIVVNNKMFSMLSSIEINSSDADEQQFWDMIKNITSLKVLTTGDVGIANDMTKRVKQYLNKSNLDELMRIKDGDQMVSMYIREGKDEFHVTELLMFVNGLKEITSDQNISINGEKRDIETVILFLNGDIDLRQISTLSEKMDVPGVKHFKKAGQ